MHLQYEGHSEGRTQDKEPHNNQHEQRDERTEAPEEDNNGAGREEGDDGRDARPEAPGDDTGPYGREHQARVQDRQRSGHKHRDNGAVTTHSDPGSEGQQTGATGNNTVPGTPRDNHRYNNQEQGAEDTTCVGMVNNEAPPTHGPTTGTRRQEGNAPSEAAPEQDTPGPANNQHVSPPADTAPGGLPYQGGADDTARGADDGANTHNAGNQHNKGADNEAFTHEANQDETRHEAEDNTNRGHVRASPREDQHEGNPGNPLHDANTPQQATSLPEATLDTYGLLKARERATDIEITRCGRAIIDHISMAHCAGFEGGAFDELQRLWRGHAVQWAGTFSDACRTITELLETPHQNEQRDKLNLERALKWKFILPTLLLQNPPLNKGTKAADLMPIVQCRLNQYDARDWAGLVADYEADVITALLICPVDRRS